jgi:large subunit ribosomal protein L23
MKNANDIILRPVISEKADSMRDDTMVYTFEVHRDANKIEVRKAVEEIFKVKVREVRIANVRGDFKRVGKTAGQKRDWKKAYVSLKDGSINLFDTV